MICTTYFLTFFSELIPPTGIKISVASSLLVILAVTPQTTKLFGNINTRHNLFTQKTDHFNLFIRSYARTMVYCKAKHNLFIHE